MTVLEGPAAAAISTEAVVNTILTDSEGVSVINIISKAHYDPANPVDIPPHLMDTPLYKGDYYLIPGTLGEAYYHTEAVERYKNCTGAGFQTEHWHLDSATGGPPLTKMDASDVKKMESIRMCWEPLTWRKPIINYPSTMTYDNLSKQYS